MLQSTLHKLFGYNFRWNCLQSRDKLSLAIRMRTVNSLKHTDAICLKFGDRIFPSLTKSGLKSKASISSTVKGNLQLYCHKCSAFAIAFMIWNIWSTSQRRADCDKNLQLCNRVLFVSRFLNGAHSISDIKLSFDSVWKLMEELTYNGIQAILAVTPEFKIRKPKKQKAVKLDKNENEENEVP